MIILLKRILSFIAIAVFSYIFYKVVLRQRPLFRRNRRNKSGTGKGEVERMEKDPVCGTYVPEKTSLKLKSEGTMYHFCSDKCRDEYITVLKK